MVEDPTCPEPIESFRLRVVESARKLKGTPFHHQGRVPKSGIDCIGMLVCVALDLGIPHKDRVDYPRFPSADDLIRGLEDAGLIRGSQIQTGSVIAFWIRHKDKPQHVGIKTEDRMIHTWYSVGKCVEHEFDSFWQERVHSVWEFPWQR